MSRLLITGGWLVDPDLPLRQADLLIDGDRIAGIGTGLSDSADRVIRATDKLIMPGFVNAHTHSGHTLARGLVDNLPLDLWMVYVSYGGGAGSPRETYVAAALGALELLRTGTTAIVDHAPRIHLDDFDTQVDALMAAYRDVGIRAAVAPLYSDVDYFRTLPVHLLADQSAWPSLGTPLPTVGDLVAALRRFLERYGGQHPRLSCLLGPSTPERCTRDLLEESVALAGHHGVGLHMHLLETKSQRMTLDHTGRSIVEDLVHIGLAGPGNSFAHGVWLSEREIALLAESRVAVVHCPISNLKLGSGVAPLQAMLAAGLSVALGGDGAAANDSQNMFEVMKQAALIHKLYGSPDRWPTADTVLRLCLHGGARVLGMPVGSLRPGYLADLVMLDRRRLFDTPKPHLLNQLVYGELGQSVDTVIVGGQVVIQQGRAVLVDEDALYAEANDLVRGLYRDLDRRRGIVAQAEAPLWGLHAAVLSTPVGFDRRLSGG
jgi:5-methylthioadenosine/S-adenosylhomocysteine deaminase